MILKGSQRSGAKALADHLMNDRDNDHVNCLELRGFLSEHLHGALSEVHAISKATFCKQFMFSLSLNPPQDHVASEQEFLDAADRAEKALGLEGQPRAIVMHEKEGRRHAHAVWSRIHPETLTAINLPHFKNKLRDLSRDLFLDHGWVLPDGLATYGNKSPLNFTLEEWQMAKRQGLDPREIKQAFQQAWERSDGLRGFQSALEDRGYFLARADRRGFVALDVNGKVYAISKWIGFKAKDVKAKLGSSDELPSVSEAQTIINAKVSDQLRGYIRETKHRQAQAFDPLHDELRALNDAHRKERQKLKDGQSKRWRDETQKRQERFNKGLRGLVDLFKGKAKAIREQNERETREALKRDQDQRNFMVAAQMKERRALQDQFSTLNMSHRKERSQLAQMIKHSLKRRTILDRQHHRAGHMHLKP